MAIRKRLLEIVVAGLFVAAPMQSDAQAQGPPTPVNAPLTPTLSTNAPPNGLGDPTRNVLDKVLDAVTRLNDLMLAAKERQDDIRSGDRNFNAMARDAETRRVNDLRETDKQLREAETRRINELSAQKQIFDLELARVIRAGQDSSTLLLAGAVKEVKSDSSERFSKLEQFANEQRGRASGQGESYAFIWALVGAIGLIGGLIVGALGAFRHKKPETDPELITLLREMRTHQTPNGNGAPPNVPR